MSDEDETPHEHLCTLWPNDARHFVCECACGAIADGPIAEDGTRAWREISKNPNAPSGPETDL
jgi:hypothetical protein